MEKYWKSIEEYKGTAEVSAANEDAKGAVSLINMLDEKTSSSRRDFLKFFGFTVSSAALAASCQRPVTMAIPYLNQPEEVISGKANYYATAFFDGNEFAPILVKVREWRPIKIEGNNLSAKTNGATTATVQASVLSLYR
ncbi:MAG: TAT-variant-translocated molybdopterin oxidoreductase [Bacteroidales bacterium]|nr:TAT-variant-translocated molybdopterin oxidoreductase [Bacteroidales bacterium]